MELRECSHGCSGTNARIDKNAELWLQCFSKNQILVAIVNNNNDDDDDEKNKTQLSKSPGGNLHPSLWRSLLDNSTTTMSSYSVV